jgi:Spore germination protein
MLIFSGCGLLQKLGLQKGAEDELHPVSSIVMGEDEAKKLTDKAPVRLYFANEDNTKLMLEIKYIPVSDIKQSTGHLASVIVNELINGPTKDSGNKAVIPTGTKLRSTVVVKDGVATVDLSKEFKSKHPGGKDAEKMTIFSIVNSLTELKDIQKVKFTIVGKTEKEYMGNYQFDVPFTRSASLIDKDSVTKGVGKDPNNTDTTKKNIPKETEKKSTDKKTTSDDSSAGSEGVSGDVSGDDIEFLE